MQRKGRNVFAATGKEWNAKASRAKRHLWPWKVSGCVLRSDEIFMQLAKSQEEMSLKKFVVCSIASLCLFPPFLLFFSSWNFLWGELPHCTKLLFLHAFTVHIVVAEKQQTTSAVVWRPHLQEKKAQLFLSSLANDTTDGFSAELAPTPHHFWQKRLHYFEVFVCVHWCPLCGSKSNVKQRRLMNEWIAKSFDSTDTCFTTQVDLWWRCPFALADTQEDWPSKGKKLEDDDDCDSHRPSSVCSQRRRQQKRMKKCIA